MVAKNPTTH